MWSYLWEVINTFHVINVVSVDEKKLLIQISNFENTLKL